MDNATPAVRNFFIDEAGDATLFDGRGRILVGTEGCSRCFLMGALEVADPVSLTQDMETLRARLVADPYFAGVPSMQSGERKTALFFHAKDDLPEVRRDVFTLLLKHELRFYAVVRRKEAVINYVRGRNASEPNYRYNPRELYNDLVPRLFSRLPREEQAYNIYFARRVRSDRADTLRNALLLADNRFNNAQRATETPALQVIVRASHEQTELQAVDYFLWALQRLYEKSEERFVKLLWPKFRLVHDIDDLRGPRGGMEYTQKEPLNSAALQSVLSVPGI